MADMDSALYRGNVTFRIDPTWGISGLTDTQNERLSSRLLSLSVRETSPDAYERCKATRTCVRASSNYVQHDGKRSSTFQYYHGGKNNQAILFEDFEDWRQGAYGWKQSCDWEKSSRRCLPRSKVHGSKPKGAHWSPFDFDSLGPNVPTYGGKWNQGLVLNADRKIRDIQLQTKRIKDLEDHIQWLGREMFSSSMDPSARFRKDVINQIMDRQKIYLELLRGEQEILLQLSSSQCGLESCYLLFNTSSLLMTGSIEATGYIGTTPDGSEVAIWSFDSVDLGQEVVVETTGQRAMALLSRSSLYINTSIVVRPGTLGGFPGGYSVARPDEYRFRSVCRENFDEKDRETKCYGKDNCCPGDVKISELASGQVSNNINGPGSPSVRVYLHT